MNYDPYENVRKQCDNCALWDDRYETYIPTGERTPFGPEVTRACLCKASHDGPDVASDALLADIQHGRAYVFTAAPTHCLNWNPSEEFEADIKAAMEEYESSIVWHHKRGLYPGINCPPL